MPRRPALPNLPALLGLALLALAAGGSAAQQPGAAPPAATPAERAREQAEVQPSEEIDQILEEEEEVLAGEGYTYDPGNRRDPFKSLLAPERAQAKGPRREGIPGLLIDEIDLTGIFRTSRGYVAQVKPANQAKSYLLREGDQLHDGDVVSISGDAVVFRQRVDDATALKPFREVVKKLNPA